MKSLGIGLALALLGSTAMAQTSAATGPETSGARSGPGASSQSESRSREGASGATVRAGGERTSLRGETHVRTERRERTGVSVRTRIDEPSVSVRRHRTIAVRSAEPETRAYVRVKGKKKKYVVRSKKPKTAYVRTRTHRTIEEPSISVTRRTSVRTHEAPAVRSHVSVEERRSTTRTRTEGEASGSVSSTRTGSRARSEGATTTSGSGRLEGGINRAGSGSQHGQ